MARRTIHQLTELTEVEGNDELAVYDTSTSSTKKSKVFQIAIPVGVILPYGGATAPDGWLLCNGEEKDISAYQNLYDVIGNSFGTASLNTKFVLPDMRESVPKGAGETGKTVGNHVKTGGLAIGEFIDDRVQGHSHLSLSGSPSGSGVFVAQGVTTGTTSALAGGGVATSSMRQGLTTEVKAVGVNYIIKY